MVCKLFKKIFGSRNERLVKAMGKVVAQINDFEPALQPLTDEQLKAKTEEVFKGYQIDWGDSDDL